MLEIVLGVATVLLLNVLAVFSFCNDRHKEDMEGHTLLFIAVALFIDYCFIKYLFF